MGFSGHLDLRAYFNDQRRSGKKATCVCRCGWAGANGEACKRGPRCAADYQARVSGPMMDRIDLHVDVPPVTPADLALPSPVEGTAEAAARVARAREAQNERGRLNAQLSAELLDHVAEPDSGGRALINQAAEAMGLTARGYHRVLRAARTIADLDATDAVRRVHIAEALSLRRAAEGAKGGQIAAKSSRLKALP